MHSRKRVCSHFLSCIIRFIDIYLLRAIFVILAHFNYFLEELVTLSRLYRFFLRFYKICVIYKDPFIWLPISISTWRIKQLPCIHHKTLQIHTFINRYIVWFLSYTWVSLLLTPTRRWELILLQSALFELHFNFFFEFFELFFYLGVNVPLATERATGVRYIIPITRQFFLILFQYKSPNWLCLLL